MITAVRDASDNVIESHSYDGLRATNSYGPGEDVSSIQYNLAGRTADERRTVYQWESGKIETHYLRPVGREMRTVEISGGCTSCGSGDGVFVYDVATGNTTREQDSRGYIHETTYLGDGRTSSRRTNLRPSDCDPRVSATGCRQTPDALATVTLVTTEASVTTSYTYDSVWTQKPATITTASALSGDRVESFTYDSLTGEVSVQTVTGATGIPTTTQSRTTTIVRYDGTEGAAFTPGGSVFSSSWATLPQPRFRKSIDGPLSGTSDTATFVYYPIDAAVPAALRGRVAAVRNPLGHETRYEGYDAFGNVTRTIEPNGVASETTYDTLGRMLTSKIVGDPSCSTSVDPLCATDIVLSTRTYNGAQPLDTETSAAGGVTKYEYDSQSRVSAVSRGPSLTDLRERVETDYDPATGKVSAKRTLANANGSWVVKTSETSTYNTLGELITVTHADNASIGYTYEPGGQIATVRDENHAAANTTYVYDAGGRLARVEQKLASASSGKAVTSYVYDKAGNLISVTDPNGNVTSYLYDDFGQLLRQTSPVTGVTLYVYDVAGNLTSTTDAVSATTSRTYDVLGRVLTSTSTGSGTTETVTWTYDSGTFGIGRLATMSDPTGTTSYAYDRRGLPRQETKTISGSTYVTGYEHDAAGNRSKIVYPSGRVVTFGYDYASRPLTSSAGTTPLVTSAEYLPFGPITKIVYGNGTTKQMTFDSRYRLDTNKLTTAAGDIVSYDYGYDAAGNITAVADLLDPAYNRTFQYDDLNRLTVADSGTSLWGTGSYTYDAMGNLLSSTLGTRTFTAYLRDTTPRYNAVTENGATRYLSYDQAGNERAVGASIFDYNARNQLASSGAHRYGYDGRGVRVSTVVEGGCPLTVTFAGSSSSYSDAGGTGRVDVTALPGCVWTAVSSASWLTLGAQTASSVPFAVAPHTGTTARTATITIGDHTVMVSQNGTTNGSDGSDVNGNGGAEIIAHGRRTGEVVIRTTNGLTVSGATVATTVADLYWRLVGSGDFDGDGDADLLWRHGWAGQVNIHRMQNGALVSITPIYTEADRDWRIAAIGDVNGDGKADILTRNHTTGAVVERLMNGTTITSQATVLTEPDLTWRLVAAADFNGDGLADLLWRNGRTGEVQVQHRSGTTFAARTTAFTRSDLARVIAGVGDIDVDGKADILMHDLKSGVLEVAYRNGASAATTLRVETDTLWSVAQFGDYDGNGTADVLWRNSRSGGLRTSLIVAGGIYITHDVVNASDRALSIPSVVRIANAQAGPRVDTLADGRSDVIWRHTPTGDIAVWQINGGTIVQSVPISRVVEPGWEIRGAGDLNRDGTADLVWCRASTGSVAFWYLKGSILGSDYLFFNDATRINWNVEVTADLGGDGETDLVFRHLTNGMVHVMEGLKKTNTQWEPDVYYSIAVPDLNWRLVGSGDFNADGRSDLLWWHQNTGQLAMWQMTGGGVLEGRTIYNVALDWKPQRVGDFSGDGRADILWRNTSTGALSWWEMNGFVFVAQKAATLPGSDTGYTVQPASGDYNGDGYEDVLWRHTNGDVVTWEMAAPGNPVPRTFGSVGAEWVVQRVEPRAQPTSGGSATALATTTSINAAADEPWWTEVVEAELAFWTISTPARSVTLPRIPGPPFWAPAHGLTGPIPGPPTVPPGLGSTSTGIASSMSDADASSTSSKSPSIMLANAVTTSVRHSLYTPELNLLAETDLTTGTPTIAHEYVWFAGQPIAQIDVAADTIAYTFTDHLGTPVIQTDSAVNVVWRVEYEPYGKVHSQRAGAMRHQPLRFPGQEYDTLVPELAYNVYRWYRSGWGRYTQADPLGLAGDPHPYGYGLMNPVVNSDPLGLKVRMCCKLIPITQKFYHCYFQFDSGWPRTLALHGTRTGGGVARGAIGRDIGTVIPDDDFDLDPSIPEQCGSWISSSCDDPDECVRTRAFRDYPQTSRYSLLRGPNSNTFAKTIGSLCFIPGPPIAGTWRTPGWGAARPN